MSGSGKAEIGVQKHSSVEEKIWRTIYLEKREEGREDGGSREKRRLREGR